MPLISRIPLSDINWPLLGVTGALVIIGCINLYSASNEVFARQLTSLGLGIVALALIVMLDYRILERSAYYLYVAFLVVLIVTLISGYQVAGAQSWLVVGPIRFQPSEPAKIALILALAKFYHLDRGSEKYSLAELWIPLTLLGATVILVMLQPDTGTALMLMLVGGGMILFVGITRRLWVSALGLMALAAPLAWGFLKPHQRARLSTFLNPEQDPLGAGYNLLQSKIAIGSGGIAGVGYGQGTQTQLAFLPEQHTDFIFSVLAEEWGFVGVTVTLGLYLMLMWIGITIARNSRDKFGALMAFGVVALFAGHVVVNIAMITGLLPVIGIPAPFLSFGGSFLITIFIGVGLLESVSMRRRVF